MKSFGVFAVSASASGFAMPVIIHDQDVAQLKAGLQRPYRVRPLDHVITRAAKSSTSAASKKNGAVQ